MDNYSQIYNFRYQVRIEKNDDGLFVEANIFSYVDNLAKMVKTPKKVFCYGVSVKLLNMMRSIFVILLIAGLMV